MGLLDILGYVGDTIGKPGRAVRGALGGRPDEIMAALPFSDSLGLTDEANEVSGKDLLHQLGIDTGQELGGDIAGMGVEALTDPLSYLGAGLAAKGVRGATRGTGAVRRGFNEAEDVFDLVPKGAPDAVDDAMRGQLIDRAFPVPTGPAVEEAAPAASPLVDRLAGMVNEAPPDPASQLLDQIPPIQSSGFHIGYGPGSNYNGIGNDMLLDGAPPVDALRATFGGWDTALSDLERLSAEGSSRLSGTHHLDEEMAQEFGLIPGIDQSSDGAQWTREANNRYGELQAILGLGRAVPPDVTRAAIEQSLRMRPFITDSHASPAQYAVRDILNGAVRPSEVGGHMDYLRHLGVDERELRRIAAANQEHAALENLGHRMDQLGLEDEPVAGLLDRFDNVSYLNRLLTELLDPQMLTRNANIEPNIARRVLGPTFPMDLAHEQTLTQLGEIRGLHPQVAARAEAVGLVRDQLEQWLAEMLPRVSTIEAGTGLNKPWIDRLEAEVGRDNVTRRWLAERFGVPERDLHHAAYNDERRGELPGDLRRIFQMFTRD